MTAATVSVRPDGAVLAHAETELAYLIQSAAARAVPEDAAPLALALAAAAVADHLGADASPWVRQARVSGASWQMLADALGTARSTAHGRFRHVDGWVR